MEIGQDLRVNDADNLEFHFFRKKVYLPFPPLAAVAIPVA